MLVKIKTWTVMEEEFGTDRNGNILFGFTKEVENLIPNNRIISVDKFYQWRVPKVGVLTIPACLIEKEYKKDCIYASNQAYTIYGKKIGGYNIDRIEDPREYLKLF